MIDQLDSRRAQVYIESLIVEVDGDNAADFGFQWQGLSARSGDKNGLVGRHQLRQPTAAEHHRHQSAGRGRRAPSAVGAGPEHRPAARTSAASTRWRAIARFLQTQANTNILSTPNLITLDNEEAKIVVGQNVPFVTGQFTNTGTGTTNPFQTIERKDVGITLRIKPQIGEGGTVRMTIFQEPRSVDRHRRAGTMQRRPDHQQALDRVDTWSSTTARSWCSAA